MKTFGSKLWLMIEIAVLVIRENDAGYRRVCYYTNWAQYRPGIGKFTPSNVDPALCTHIVYAFAKITNDQLDCFEWNDEQSNIPASPAYGVYISQLIRYGRACSNYEDIIARGQLLTTRLQQQGYTTPRLKSTFGIYEKSAHEINNLKKRDPELKTLLAVGGWNQASTEFSPMVSDADKRSRFVRTSISFLREHGFDGLDLDWEYPALRNGANPTTDKENFGILCRELRQAYEDEARKTGNQRLLLSAAVAAGKSNIDAAYDVPTISQYLDFISLMSYDMHGGTWERKTGHNSPLFSRDSETEVEKQMNVAWATQYWVNLGTPKSKLNIGLATYGRGFRLANPSNYGLGAAATGPNTRGAFTGEDGYLSYYEICMMQSGGGKRYWSEEHKVPYYVVDDQWIGYDDEQSISHKVAWLVKGGYGGAMIWTLPLDDFNQECSFSIRPYPLVNRIKDDLIRAENGGEIVPSTPVTSTRSSTTTNSTTKTTTKSTTTKPTTKSTLVPSETTPSSGASSGSTCFGQKDGRYPYAPDCSTYMWCIRGRANLMSCQNGLHWNPSADACDWPENANCIPRDNKISSDVPTTASTTASTSGNGIANNNSQQYLYIWTSTICAMYLTANGFMQ